MKSFWQYLEAAQFQKLRKMPITDFRHLISQLPRKTAIQFALDCAEEVLHFITEPEEQEAALECIKLVKHWLADPTSISSGALESAGGDFHRLVQLPNHAAFATIYTTYAAASPARNIHIFWAIDSAAEAYGRDNWQKVFERYIQHLENLTGEPSSTYKLKELQQLLQGGERDIAHISALWDFIEENDIISQQDLLRFGNSPQDIIKKNNVNNFYRTLEAILRDRV